MTIDTDIEIPMSLEEVSEDALHQKFLTQLEVDADDIEESRERATEEARFINVPGGQWDDFLENEFSNRTKLQVDQTSEVVHRFQGEQSLNRTGVEFKPTDAKTSDKEAELLNGIFRADFADNSGSIAFKQAIQDLGTVGYGAIRLRTAFVDPEDPANDLQRIIFSPIYAPYETIVWDHNARRIDKSDARWVHELIPFTKDSFEETYPGMDPVTAYEPETRFFRDFTTRMKELIYVAVRYHVVKKKSTAYLYGNLATNEVEVYNLQEHKKIEEQLKKDPLREFIREKDMVERSVWKTVFSGREMLNKPVRIPGVHIPIIPFYGYRDCINGQEYYYGLVRKLMDPQRTINTLVSQVLENACSNGQEVPIFDPEQMTPKIKALWADRNNKPYMLAKSLRQPDGTIIKHGPVATLNAQRLDQSTTVLLELIPQMIQQMTGGAPQDTMNPEASGKAIKALIQRENLKTKILHDHAAASMMRLGEVYAGMAGEIYTSRRIIKTLGMDGTEGQVQLLKEIQDPDTGLVMISNNLRGKRFQAISDVGPQYESLREQTVEDIKGMIELLKDNPAGAKYTPILTSMMLENMTGVGLRELKKIVRRDLIIQGVKGPESDEEKQMVANLEEQSLELSAEDMLAQAAAQQLESEGQKFLSEARNLDSKSIDNLASARKKEAQTRKILQEAGNSRQLTLNTLLQSNFDRANALPLVGG